MRDFAPRRHHTERTSAVRLVEYTDLWAIQSKTAPTVAAFGVHKSPETTYAGSAESPGTWHLNGRRVSYAWGIVAGMPTMQFQPTLREIRDVLQSDYYFIPRFQRPFAWTSENLEDFWRDTLVDNESGYFIGPVVVYEDRKSYLGLVDGQQRLTTIMLIMSALRDVFVELGEESLTRGVKRYIERADDEDKKHFVLKSLAAEQFFQSQILKDPPRTKVPATRDEERELLKAHGEIANWVRAKIEGKSREGSTASLSEAASILRSMRDQILALKVIWIKLDDEDDAYIVFETLNSRGKNLEVVDLLKNHLFSAIKQNNADLDEARTQWSRLREVLDGAGANANKFILHWWLSRGEYTAEKKLFRLLKSKLVRNDAPETLAALLRDAELYALIARPEAWNCKEYEKSLKGSLAALNIFGVRQPRPMLLALLREYAAGNLKYARVRRAARIIENFHFQTTAIVGVSSTGGVSEMYAKHARELTLAGTTAAKDKAINGLLAKLTSEQRVPSEAAFISEFGRTLRYSETERTNKRLVQYALAKLHDTVRPGHAIDHAKCNIEHVSSQSLGEDYMASVGNLLWIDAELNALLGAKDFDEKRSILLGYRNTYDIDDLLSAEVWGAAQVEQRTRRLAELALADTWSL